jgi:hypothetical protein
MLHIFEKLRRLAVYNFGTDKELGKDVKDIAVKALQPPESLEYLKDDDEYRKGCFYQILLKRFNKHYLKKPSLR